MSDTSIVLIVLGAVLILNIISLGCIHWFDKESYQIQAKTKKEKIFFNTWMVFFGLTYWIGKAISPVVEYWRSKF